MILPKKQRGLASSLLSIYKGNCIKVCRRAEPYLTSWLRCAQPVLLSTRGEEDAPIPRTGCEAIRCGAGYQEALSKPPRRVWRGGGEARVRGPSGGEANQGAAE